MITAKALYNANSYIKLIEDKIVQLEIRKSYGASILANTYQAH